ncbi:hypothetical protein LTR85_008032 [Meristemomyces frigidus]|nr:hypothetical protein LTR85_008032 [Meristemomyces frigidus]
MDPRNMSMSDEIDWNDPHFNNVSEFQDALGGDSPYNTNAFNELTNIDQYADSSNMAMRTPSKSAAAHNHPSSMGLPTGPSAESSSQDSASDSSSRRKRKVTESPISDPATEMGAKTEDSMMQIGEGDPLQQYDQYPTRPMHDLTLDHDNGMFDFGSAASSPVQPRDFNTAMSLNAQVHVPTSSGAPQYRQSPVQTINPGMFQMVNSRDESPVTNNMMFNNASPNAIFSSGSSNSEDAYGNQAWNGGMAQNPAWPNEYNQFASPGALGFTPSPVVNGATPAVASRGQAAPMGRSPLHIAPISTKSRVETQINVIMTLEKPPPGVDHLHLPLHTIAKSKLLAKEEIDRSKALELHTMLVCTSAMSNSHLREKALKRAAAQSNEEIQQRAEQLRDTGDEEKNDQKNMEEADKPANGGEVRICNNCIQRERKRAGRKKLKKEEEQQHWERYETERVVVFNSNEYLPFKPYDPSQREGGMSMEDKQYTPPEGSIQCTAAMRIACYCRHQSEKEGFQVIFTLKDQQGNVVAQQMSDSILITDDHKTHPPTFPATTLGEGVFFQNAAAFAPNGLPMSQSMVDLHAQMHPFTSSRSTGNLQSLAYGQQQFNPHSHVHQLPQVNTGYSSQATSATMTPTSLSRPASPTSAGQAGPNKKRKSSSFHRRVPSGLTMTPRVDTSQPPSSNLPSAISAVTSPFSPTGDGFSGGGGGQQQSYMTIPANNGPAQYYNSGPPTPSENYSGGGGQHGGFTQSQIDQHLARSHNAQAYFSHPSSAVPSRAASPVLQQTRSGPMAAYARQQQQHHQHPPPIQTPTNQQSMQGLARQQPQQQQHGQYQMHHQHQQSASVSASGSSSAEPVDNTSPPTITKITPADGPYLGGTDVAIYGYNFQNGMQVLFGEKVATTVYYGPQALLATSPPSRPGGVNVTLLPPNGQPGSSQYSPNATVNRQIFTYTDQNPKMMEMALRYMSQQQTGDQMRWNSLANQYANQYVSSNVGRAGIGGQQSYEGGPGSGNMMATDSVEVEEAVLKIFDAVDVSESPRQPCYDLASEDGETMLGLACAGGMHRVAAALLARGANPDASDKGGYTPMMHAAVHARAKTFQLLLVKGADPSIRSLVGYSAIDLAPDDAREEFQRILDETRRSRCVRRPSLHPAVSYGSYAPSWDISSASFYDSENIASVPVSRRPSAVLGLPATPEEAGEPPHMPSGVAAPATMMAWRDGLASQIQHFQHSMSGFQLRPLPQLPDYHECALVRRLSSLVPGRSPSPALPPPAYSELFPDKIIDADDHATKKRAVTAAVVDAVADEKCAAMFEQGSACSSTSASTECAACPNKADNRAMSSWLLVS